MFLPDGDRCIEADAAAVASYVYRGWRRFLRTDKSTGMAFQCFWWPHADRDPGQLEPRAVRLPSDHRFDGVVDVLPAFPHDAASVKPGFGAGGAGAAPQLVLHVPN